MSSGRAPAPRTSRPTNDAGTPSLGRAPSAALRASAQTITLEPGDAGAVTTILQKLPDPGALPGGTLVLVPGKAASVRSFGRALLGAFGRAKTIPRAFRCSALVARGFIDVGAATTEDGDDLAWGYVAGKQDAEAS